MIDFNNGNKKIILSIMWNKLMRKDLKKGKNLRINT